MIIRRLCEVYGYTPQQIGELTIEQVWLLCCEEEDLKRRRTVTGTLEELRAQGIEPVGVDFNLTLHDMIYPKKPKATKAERRRRAREAVEAARRESN